MQFSLTQDLPNPIIKDSSLECIQSHTHFLLYCYSLDLGGAGYRTPQTERRGAKEMEALCFPHPPSSWLTTGGWRVDRGHQLWEEAGGAFRYKHSVG